MARVTMYHLPKPNEASAGVAMLIISGFLKDHQAPAKVAKLTLSVLLNQNRAKE